MKPWDPKEEKQCPHPEEHRKPVRSGLRSEPETFDCTRCTEKGIRYDAGPLVIEMWRAIPGWEGRYDVSSFGRVRGLLSSNGTPWKDGPRIIKTWPDKHGILKVSLYLRGQGTSRVVARLVLTTFVRAPSSREYACSLNMDPLDCRLSNLEWRDRLDTGRRDAAGLVVLDAELVCEARLRVDSGEGVAAVARDMGVDGSRLWAAVTGQANAWAGLPVPPVPPRRPAPRRTPDEIREIGRRFDAGESGAAIARALQIHKRTVQGIIARRAWDSLPPEAP